MREFELIRSFADIGIEAKCENICVKEFTPPIVAQYGNSKMTKRRRKIS